MIHNRDLRKKYAEIFTTDMYRACWRTSWGHISSCSYRWCWSAEWHWHCSLRCLFHRMSSVLNRQLVSPVLPRECPPHMVGTFHCKLQLLTKHAHITIALQNHDFYIKIGGKKSHFITTLQPFFPECQLFCPVRHCSRPTNNAWLMEQGLTSHQTHYRSYRGRFLQVIWPNQQCQSTEGNQLVFQIRPGSHQDHSIMLQ